MTSTRRLTLFSLLEVVEIFHLSTMKRLDTFRNRKGVTRNICMYLYSFPLVEFFIRQPYHLSLCTIHKQRCPRETQENPPKLHATDFLYLDPIQEESSSAANLGLIITYSTNTTANLRKDVCCLSAIHRDVLVVPFLKVPM